MYRNLFIILLLATCSVIHYNCAPSMRSAKIQSGFSVDGALLGSMLYAHATDEQGNDASKKARIGNSFAFDAKFRYGWERKNYLGFELNGGLDSELGAYLELPGSKTFHWGMGIESNLVLLAIAEGFDVDENDEVSRFINKHNFHAYIMGGYFPDSNKEISIGIKYQPFLRILLEQSSKVDINTAHTFPVTFLIDGRYMFAKHLGFIGGTEFFYLSLSGVRQEQAKIVGGFLYVGFTFR